jgi:DNA-binding CsgD family transcriptional regulator
MSVLTAAAPVRVAVQSSQRLLRDHSIPQTARALGIAPKTVENVQTRLFRKLGVRNRPGALAVADAFGLLPPGALRPV